MALAQGMAAPVLQIAATPMPQHLSDRVLMFILADPLAAQAAAGLSKAWRKCILATFRGPLCLSAIVFEGESEQRALNITRQGSHLLAMDHAPQ